MHPYQILDTLDISSCKMFTCTVLHKHTRANINNCPIHVCPLGCAVHAKWYTLQLKAYKNGILFVTTPHVYWKLEGYQNVTLPTSYTSSCTNRQLRQKRCSGFETQNTHRTTKTLIIIDQGSVVVFDQIIFQICFHTRSDAKLSTSRRNFLTRTLIGWLVGWKGFRFDLKTSLPLPKMEPLVQKLVYRFKDLKTLPNPYMKSMKSMK